MHHQKCFVLVSTNVHIHTPSYTGDFFVAELFSLSLFVHCESRSTWRNPVQTWEEDANAALYEQDLKFKLVL